MDTRPNDPSSPSFDPFEFVLKGRFPQPENVDDLDTEAKERRQAYDERLKQRFVKFPYLTGLLVARVFNCPVLIVLLELMWRSYSHHNQNPVPLPNVGLEISRDTKYRVLRRLEQAKVIKLIQRKGKCPLVQLNWLPLNPQKSP